MASLPVSVDTPPVAPDASQAAIVWRRFRSHRLALIGLAVLALLFAFSFAGPYFTSHGPEDQFLAAPMGSPSAAFPLGTDELGRDVLVRMMWAGRVSLTLAFSVVVVETLIGSLYGAIAGYAGGWLDAAAMRFVDFMLTLPTLPLLLILSAMNLRGGLPIPLPDALSGLFGAIWGMSAERAQGILVLIFVLILFGWMNTARLVRGQVLALRDREFAEAARALGASSGRVILTHMLPNALAPIIVAATLDFGTIIITEAALSFLGFGVQPPSPSWGNMLNNLRDFMLLQPWRALVPGLAIFFASISFNFVGDALRDALDPRLKV